MRDLKNKMRQNNGNGKGGIPTGRVFAQDNYGFNVGITDVVEHEDLGSSMGGKVGGNRRFVF